MTENCKNGKKAALPKAVDGLLFPNYTEKHWRLREKYLATKSRARRLWLLWRITKIQKRFNASIPICEKVKPFTAPHGLSGIFISAAAEIDEGCTVFQNVTVGSNTIKGHKRYGAPKVGKNVVIGANAVVIGAVKIGEGARIGAGAAVAADVPENATAVAQRPRIIERTDSSDNAFNPITE